MTNGLTLSLAIALGAGAVGFSGMGAPALAEPPSAQGEARREMRAGNILKRRELENIAFASVGQPVCRTRDDDAEGDCARYIAGDYDPAAMAYRFKFMRGRQVIFIDVDARTGRVLRKVE